MQRSLSLKVLSALNTCLLCYAVVKTFEFAAVFKPEHFLPYAAAAIAVTVAVLGFDIWLGYSRREVRLGVIWMVNLGAMLPVPLLMMIPVVQVVERLG